MPRASSHGKIHSGMKGKARPLWAAKCILPKTPQTMNVRRSDGKFFDVPRRAKGSVNGSLQAVYEIRRGDGLFDFRLVDF